MGGENSGKEEKLDCSSAEFFTVTEGLCVQIMHIGPFNDEPKSVAQMDTFLEQNGYENDMNETRLHHEIYMSDARKVAPEKWKTVIRHPLKKIDNFRLVEIIALWTSELRSMFMMDRPVIAISGSSINLNLAHQRRKKNGSCSIHRQHWKKGGARTG